MFAGWIPASERYDINFLTQQHNGTNRTDASQSTYEDSPAANTTTAGSPDGGPAANTTTAGSSDSGQAANITTTDLVLWPFDRGESRGKLKAATMRISADELLVLSYRFGSSRQLHYLIGP